MLGHLTKSIHFLLFLFIGGNDPRPIQASLRGVFGVPFKVAPSPPPALLQPRDLVRWVRVGARARKEGRKLPELLKICVISPTLKVSADAISYRLVSALLQTCGGAAAASSQSGSPASDSLHRSLSRCRPASLKMIRV